ncbi:MAG TPA: hypothetical protein VGU02_16560 [Gaiellaceae bacterium]|nr:hypothetical protein [Gaiellaceae bacterium]
MWALRELTRLLGRILVGVAIAIVIAGIKALVSGGGTFWTFRIICMLLGGFYLLLGAAGTGSAASHRVNWMSITPLRGNPIARFSTRRRPEDPTLTPTAVFIASGLVLLSLGAAL